MEKKQSENEKVLEYIYSKIEDGSLKLGDKLPTERQIAEDLGLGRNSIREATSILRGMGLIESVQGSGNYISEKFPDSIKRMVVLMVALGSVSKQDVCEYRKTMEKSVCHLLISKGISAKKKQEIEAVLQQMQFAEDSMQIELDDKFHNLLVSATDNPLLSMLMSAVMTVISEWIEVVLDSADQKEKDELKLYHKGIYESIIKKDSAKTNEYIDKHYEIIRKNLGY